MLGPVNYELKILRSYDLIMRGPLVVPYHYFCHLSGNEHVMVYGNIDPVARSGNLANTHSISPAKQIPAARVYIVMAR